MPPAFQLTPGVGPLLVHVPHAGTGWPDNGTPRLAPRARSWPDTDWFVDRLWQWVPRHGAGLMVARYSRYLVDLNRPPDDAPLYATPTPGVVPLATFAGDPVYAPGDEPGPDERDERIERWWRPHHAALAAELERLRRQHGHAVLLDAHSIASRVPSLFTGELPHLNLGSNDGTSAAPDLVHRAWRIVDSAAGFSAVRDGRFKGGYITRKYGQPRRDVHALQLEIAQRAYMTEAPPEWDDARAARLRPLLEELVKTLIGWVPPDD